MAVEVPVDFDQISVQPCEFPAFPGTLAPGQWVRAIAAPGVTSTLFPTPPIPPVTGAPDPGNLLGLSPPGLLEEYEIFAYQIGYAIALGSNAQPTYSAELAFVANGRVRHVNLESDVPTNQWGASGVYVANGSWTADLNNPIRIASYESLAIRLGAAPSIQTSATVSAGDMVAGAQINIPATAPPPLSPLPFESTISYRIVSRRRP